MTTTMKKRTHFISVYDLAVVTGDITAKVGADNTHNNKTM